MPFLILLLVVIGVCFALMYNHLVSMNTQVDSCWSQIDVQLQRRNDLIPNLVSTVKGYSVFEKSTLVKVTQMRSQMINLSSNTPGKSISRQQMMNLSSQLENALKSIFAVSENYPDLKANSDFQSLMNNLTDTENKIAYARQVYNDAVQKYDATIKEFPYNIIASKKFTAKQYIALSTPSAKNVPNVNNLLNGNTQSAQPTQNAQPASANTEKDTDKEATK